MMTLFAILLLPYIFSFLIADLNIAMSVSVIFDYKWNYDNQDFWVPTCFGKRQSPIAVSEETAIYTELPPLQFINYDEVYAANLTNTGATVDIQLIKSNKEPTISGGTLTNEYVLAGFHFHWASEHVINGYRYPLEGHFVHYAKKYGSVKNAESHPDGLAVLSTFYELSAEPNPAFYNLIGSIQEIATFLNQPIEHSVVPGPLLPDQVGQFYSYQGSLTTPNCSEVVSWTLLPSPSFLSISQTLTGIFDDTQQPLKRNFRRLQNLNGRRVYLNFP